MLTSYFLEIDGVHYARHRLYGHYYANMCIEL